MSEQVDSFRRIRSLLCYSTVVSLISQGWAATQIAEYVQQDAGECTDITLDFLADLLQKFIRAQAYQTPEASALDTLDGARPVSKVEDRVQVHLATLTFDDLLGAKMEAPINIERQMQQAIHLQEMRMAEMVNRERASGLPSRDLRREFETYVGMLTHLDAHRRAGGRAGMVSSCSAPPDALEASPSAGASSKQVTSEVDQARATHILSALKRLSVSKVEVIEQLGKVSDGVSSGQDIDDAILILDNEEGPTDKADSGGLDSSEDEEADGAT